VAQPRRTGRDLPHPPVAARSRRLGHTNSGDGAEGRGAVKLRLHGTPQECRRAVEELRGLFEVVSVSGVHPDRGSGLLVRVYLEVRLDDRPERPPGSRNGSGPRRLRGGGHGSVRQAPRRWQ